MAQSFWHHLDELRSRIIKSLAVLFLAVVVVFNFTGKILPWLIAPAGHLVFTSPGEAFGAHCTIAIVLGVIITSPFILYQLWSFVREALTEKERGAVYFFAPLSLLFFLGGVAFAWFVAVPMSYQFLMGYSSDSLVPMVSVDKYFNYVGTLVLAFGVSFEMPLVLAFLAKIGIATPAFLIQKRRHAIIIILIAAAILTPPDVVSQILLAAPLLVLYEVGIMFVKMFYKPA